MAGGFIFPVDSRSLSSLRSWSADRPPQPSVHAGQLSPTKPADTSPGLQTPVGAHEAQFQTKLSAASHARDPLSAPCPSLSAKHSPLLQNREKPSIRTSVLRRARMKSAQTIKTQRSPDSAPRKTSTSHLSPVNRLICTAVLGKGGKFTPPAQRFTTNGLGQ